MTFDEAPFPEPFGPEYVAPEPAPCPNCKCCTARLCARAENAHTTCALTAVGDDVAIVKGCPCTEGGGR